MTRRPKTSIRDAQDYESSLVNYPKFARALLRNYSAHFFRWSFARRLITANDDVFEIGCGVDCPFVNIMLGGVAPKLNTYHGVDINPLPKTQNVRMTLQGEFNFVERWNELVPRSDVLKYTVIVHLEVIEHMRVKHARELLRGCHELLCRDGRMIMSTPVYDEVRHSKRHVHEYTISEMKRLLTKSGFKITARYGTYMDIKYLNKKLGAVEYVRDEFKKYFDDDALSCIFAPMFPDESRNNLWVCERL